MSFIKSKKKKDNESENIAKIITDIQNGDNESFSKLFNICYNEVFVIAMSNVRDYDKACDITQETFIEIFNTIKSLREPEAFHSWLKKITYHRCTSYFRSKTYKHETLVDDTDEINSFFETMEEDRSDFIPEASLDNKELIRIIRTFIKELPEAQRDAVIMYYFNDMPLADIAEVQGVPNETVKSRLYYARKTLKVIIEEYEDDNDVKLHAIPVVPLLMKAIKDTDTVLTLESAGAIAEEITSACGVTTTVATASTATVGGGVLASLNAAPLVVKIVSVVAALAVVSTSGIALVNSKRSNDNSDNTTDIETVLETEAETTGPETTELETNVLHTEVETTVDKSTAVETETETDAPETEESWLGAPEVVPETTNTSETQHSEPVETSPEEKVGSIDPMTGNVVTVIKTEEGVNGTGQKYVRTYYSDGTTSTVVECAHCHQMPCPHGGNEDCPEYDAKNDGSVTCQQCGRPYGDGYNGTCYSEIDWENGGKEICHHYD